MLQEEFQQQFLADRVKVKDDFKTLQEEYKVNVIMESCSTLFITTGRRNVH